MKIDFELLIYSIYEFILRKMFTIEEIKKRKIEGKRKWGSSLILLIQDKLDEDLPIESLIEYLKETYDFILTAGVLYQLKAKYYISVSKNYSSTETLSQGPNITQTKNMSIEQITDAEKMYNAMYKSETQKTAFDLGKDF